MSGDLLKALLFSACIAFVSASAFASDPDADLRSALSEARWVHADADLARFLTITPSECLRAPKDAEKNYIVEVGRAAFRSPFLFGGTAARTGLSCNSCHRNGHDNPAFFFEGLSNAPGTADVTSSVFSKSREDDVFNPVKIPTIIDVAEKSSFGVTTPHPSLHAFVESAVKEEFQGAASDRLINAVTAYAAHLDSQACPQNAETAQSAAVAFGDARRALNAAEEALTRDDVVIAEFLLVTAQHSLGRIHERFAGPKLKKQRLMLSTYARKLGQARKRAADGQIEPDDISDLIDELKSIETSLAKKERRSLYNRAMVERFLDDSKP